MVFPWLDSRLDSPCTQLVNHIHIVRGRLIMTAVVVCHPSKADPPCLASNFVTLLTRSGNGNLVKQYHEECRRLIPSPSHVVIQQRRKHLGHSARRIVLFHKGATEGGSPACSLCVSQLTFTPTPHCAGAKYAKRDACMSMRLQCLRTFSTPDGRKVSRKKFALTAGYRTQMLCTRQNLSLVRSLHDCITSHLSRCISSLLTRKESDGHGGH